MHNNLDIIDMERVNRMDTPAFRLLYSIFYKVLVSSAYRYTADVNAAEDIVQEVFASLWEHKRSFQTQATLRAFFYSSVHNAALNWVKHQNVVSQYAKRTAGQDTATLQQSGEEVFSEEVYRQLFTAIDALPQRQREVFLLHMEGKSNTEIADALDMAVETVKTHKKRGMAYLRKHVGPECLLLLLTVGVPVCQPL